MDTKTTLLVTGLIVVVAATTIAMSVGPVYAGGGTCTGCARSFAPGQLAIQNSLPANLYAPGQKIEGNGCSGCNGASDFAPGIEKTIPTGPGP